MQIFLLATAVLLPTRIQSTSIIDNRYVFDLEHNKGVCKAILAPLSPTSVRTSDEKRFIESIVVEGKRFEVSATIVPEEQVKNNPVDLFLGRDVLNEFAIRVEPFRRRSTIFARSELSKEVTGMYLLENGQTGAGGKSERFSLSAMNGFKMDYAMELPACGDDVRDVEVVHGNLGFRTGKRLVYRAGNDGIMSAGFAELAFQTVVYDFKSGALYGADPVPAYVPTFFSVVRQPLEFKAGKLFLLNDKKPLIEVHALPIATYCEFLRLDRLKTTFEKGYLAVRTEGEPVKRIPVVSD